MKTTNSGPKFAIAMVAAATFTTVGALGADGYAGAVFAGNGGETSATGDAQHGVTGTPDPLQVAALDDAFALANTADDAIYYYMYDDEAGIYIVSCTDGTTACDIGIEDGLQAQADMIELSGAEHDRTLISGQLTPVLAGKNYTPQAEGSLLDAIATDLGIMRDNTGEAIADVGNALNNAGTALLHLLNGN